MTIGLLSRVVGRFRKPPSHATFAFNPGDTATPAAFSMALFESVGVRMEPGHAVEVVDNGRVFDRLEAEIRRSQSSVNIVIYIWEAGQASNRIIAALLDRAAAGVRCRVLVDALGSAGFEDELGPRLRQGGCEVRIFRPSLVGTALSRNHRKIVIIDGALAVTGGFGIRDCWLGDGCCDGEWRDVSAIVQGPAVHHAQQAFAENWQEAGGALLGQSAFPDVPAAGPSRAAIVSSTASPNVTRAERLTQLLIAAGTRRVWIANAYFVPSRAILDTLVARAAVGVDVRILVAGRASDSKLAFGAQQYVYRQLVAKGVRVWEYQPCMMHAKTMVVDDHLSLVGSVNLDPLSLNKLDEIALVVDDRDIAAQRASSFEADCARSAPQSS